MFQSSSVSITCIRDGPVRMLFIALVTALGNTKKARQRRPLWNRDFSRSRHTSGGYTASCWRLGRCGSPKSNMTAVKWLHSPVDISFLRWSPFHQESARKTPVQTALLLFQRHEAVWSLQYYLRLYHLRTEPQVELYHSLQRPKRAGFCERIPGPLRKPSSHAYQRINHRV